MIQLYQLSCRNEIILFSPNVWRVRLALLHKGLPFETVPWHFTEKTVLEEAQSISVPVIKDGDAWVKDSHAICLYLDEKYPDNPLIVDKDAAKDFASWVTEKIILGLFPMIAADVWDIISEKDKTYFRQTREEYLGRTLEECRDDRKAMTPAFLESLEPLRERLQASPFLSGDLPGYDDYAAGAAFIWCYCVSKYDPIASDALLCAWRDRILALHDGHARQVPTVSNWG